MPLSEESDPSGKRQKQPCTGATTAAEKAGTTDAQRAAARPFFFCPLCRAAHTAPPAAASARRAPAAPGIPPPPCLLHTMPAPPACPMPAYSRPPRPTATPAHCQPCSSQHRPPPCRACQIAAAPGLLWGGSLARWPRPPAGSPPRWRCPARRAASCNDPAPAARRWADDHGPPAPRP